MMGWLMGCTSKNFFQKSALYTGPVPDDYRQSLTALQSPDTVLIKAGSHYRKGKLHSFFLGEHYRDVWNAPVPAPVFKPENIAGGLKPIKLGGGQQTTSLTLKNEEGRQFALRTIDKTPDEVLPKWLRAPFLVNAVRDQTSAINPYAPFVLPPLSEAVGVFHTQPQLYVVADDNKSLGEFAPYFQGKAVLFERKYKDEDDHVSGFGEAVDFVDTQKMLERRYQKGTHLPDQPAFAKARLFDVLIGDWDRHENQWDWAEYKKEGRTLYKPVPKDRDQAFFKFSDGVLPWLASRRFSIRKFRTFKKEIRDIEGLLFQGNFIDQRALNELTAEDWEKTAKEMQAALPDEVIEKAIRQFPDTVYRLVGAETVAKLKARRDQLPEVAHRIYRIYSRKVTVVGSDGADKVEVVRLGNGKTSVTVRTMDEEDPEQSVQLYSRVFENKDTEEIVLHGLEGNDVFALSGEAVTGIRISIFGGPGRDKVQDASAVKRGRKLVEVNDTVAGMEVEKGKNTKVHLSKDPAVHAFDREGSR
jgi:hypothetical protein